MLWGTLYVWFSTCPWQGSNHRPNRGSGLLYVGRNDIPLSHCDFVECRSSQHKSRVFFEAGVVLILRKLVWEASALLKNHHSVFSKVRYQGPKQKHQSINKAKRNWKNLYHRQPLPREITRILWLWRYFSSGFHSFCTFLSIIGSSQISAN